MSEERLYELRQKAEDQLQSRSSRIDSLDRADLEKLTHELAVHQVELEIQNEELRITRMEAEEARDHYLDLFEFAPVGYFTLDENNRIVEANLTSCILLKINREKILNMRFTKFISPEESEVFYLFRKKLLQRDTRIELELQMQTEENIPFTAQIESLRVSQDRVRLAIIDVTERKRVQKTLALQKVELEEAYNDMEAFSSSVSHDLRGPLRRISSFCDVLMDEYSDILDNTATEYINLIVEEIQSMSQLIEDILKLSYISRTEILRENVNLSEMAKSIIDKLQAEEPERQAEIIIAPETVVQADKNLLEIGLRNLIDNAWKFSSKGTFTRIEIGTINQETEKIYFVRDNGIGFNMQYRDKLFLPFERLHTSKEYTGTGLGLAISQRVIRRHGGSIWVESEIGKGTTFYFTLK